MPRTKKDFDIRRRQIIAGALTVFAEKGFEKTTNKDIAQAAGIGSPGLIYHYFKDKWDLFQNVIIEHAPIGQLLSRQEEMMAQPPREVLTHIGTTILNAAADAKTIALLRLLFGEAMRRPVIAQMMYEAVSSRLLKLVEVYLSHQIDGGNLRRTDPKAAARCFLGPLMAYLILHDLLQFEDKQDLARETMVRTAVDIFLEGMAVKAE